MNLINPYALSVGACSAFSGTWWLFPVTSNPLGGTDGATEKWSGSSIFCFFSLSPPFIAATRRSDQRPWKPAWLACTLISSSTTAHSGLPVAESACLSQPSFSASQNVLSPHLPSSFPANVIPSQGAPPPRSLTRVLASTVASLQKSNVHK